MAGNAAASESRGAGVAARPTRASITRLRTVREQFLADPAGTDLTGVRDVIARSWRRSVACNVDPAAIHAEQRDPQIDAPFLAVALPVVERLESLARDTGVCVVLADPSGTIAAIRGDRDVLRWADARSAIVGSHVPEELAGTNSDGTALEERASVQVWGPEHWADGLDDTFCTSVPIRDVLRRCVTGVLTLMVPQKIAFATDPASLALLVEGAAAEIGRSAAARMADREQALLQAYLRESRMRGAEAVLAIDERTTIASNRAQQLLTPEDYAVLAGYAREAVNLGGDLERIVSLADDRSLRLIAKPVVADGDVVGAVVRLRERPEPEQARTRSTTREFSAMVGDSPVMAGLRAAASAAALRSSVLCVTGERGTGRALLSRLLAEAGGGTVAVVECDPSRRDPSDDFLEELRRGIESGESLIALHVDQIPVALWEEARVLLALAAGRGRLFVTAYQLTETVLETLSRGCPQEIRLPPLRSRRDDIPQLVTHFLRDRFADRTTDRPVTASGKLLHALAQADWPGNITALREVVLSAAGSDPKGEVGIGDLGELQQKVIARGRLSRLEAAELEQIRHALAESRGNRVRAAEILEIARSTLYRKIESYVRRGFDLGQ